MLHKLHSLHKLHPVGLGSNKNSKTNIITPTISLKDNSQIAEVDKTTLFKFLISGESRLNQNNLTVELLNNNKELSFTTTKWTNQDYGFSILTKVTSKKGGEFEIQFKVNNKLTNSITIQSKYINLEESTIVNDVKVIYTEDQKAKLIATVYGESARDANLMVNIPWIYYNLTNKLGFEKGLKRSSFYKNPSNNKWVAESYRICMFYLGQGNQFKEYKIVNGMKVKDFCQDTHTPFLNRYKHNLDLIRSFFENNIFNAENIRNPYYNWDGQGYWGDMDFRENNTDKTKWAKASQYFHLQKKGYVNNRYIKEFIAYDGKKDVTTYLCDDKSIEKYFKDNPDALPKFKNDDYSTIPRVHIQKDLQ